MSAREDFPQVAWFADRMTDMASRQLGQQLNALLDLTDDAQQLPTLIETGQKWCHVHHCFSARCYLVSRLYDTCDLRPLVYVEKPS